MSNHLDLKINNWVENLQSKGKYVFSLTTMQEELSGFSHIAIKRYLSRLSTKGHILSIHKGYYLIIPPQYKSKGILPPSFYLDTIMNQLNKPYYIGLLNAAAYHGSSHQQPQEFFVVTSLPVMRMTLKKGIKINYISKTDFPNTFLETKNTEAGFLKISNPILTATDLIDFEKRVGGLNRVATVLNELMEVIVPDDFNDDLVQKTAISTLQRLGFILEYILDNSTLANALFESLLQENLYRIPLKVSMPTKGFLANNRWNIIVNTKIEIDE
jgi:predicted transcriptional regulator of viral defense system